MKNKLLTLEAAVETIPSGCVLAIGGITLYRRPISFVRTLLQRHKRTHLPVNLTLLSFTAGFEADLLVGAGITNRIRTCYFGLEIFGLAPMFTYYANRGELEIVEETETSLALGLRARLAGISFMPGRAWQGTGLYELRPDVKTIRDPYTGEELTAFPAINPDVAVIHALEVDYDGNAIIGSNTGIDEELSLAAEKVIITAEKIVPSLTKADLVAPCVDAIVLAPGGAAPTSCHPLYPMDGNTILRYSEQVFDPDTFNKYLEIFL